MLSISRQACAAALAGLLLHAATSQAQPKLPIPMDKVETITRAQLLKRVDVTKLAQVHHLPPSAFAELRVLLTIDAIAPDAPIEGNTLDVTYTLTNFTVTTAQGVITGTFEGHGLVNVDGSPPENISLGPGKSWTSHLKTSVPTFIGSGPLNLHYRDKVACHAVPGPFGKPIKVCAAGVAADASADVSVSADPAKIDSDLDGIPDVVEAELLARFRPYYRFSMNSGDDETARPADARWFVQHSELFDHHTETDSNPIFPQDQLWGNPDLLLTATASIGPSLIGNPPHEVDYYLNLFNDFRPGESDWTKIQNEATGLYGHVAPLRESAGDPAAITGYKIEYWQFYAFNPVPGQIDCYSISDAHEGDWEGVELVVEMDRTTVRRVRHNIHSSSAVFEMSGGKRVDIGDGFVEFQGANATTDAIALWPDGPLTSGLAQNNLVRFFCNTDGCTHVVVYIEHGGHASWPTEHWTWPGVWNHDGNSPHAYLVATPPNLGEIAHPNTQCPGCNLVVGYDGHWGACGSDPPQGPTLHDSWGKEP